jgi:hypothetical protein
LLRFERINGDAHEHIPDFAQRVGTPPIACAAMAILIPCGAGADQARQGAPNFEIATEEGAFRGVAEAFITAAAADNRRKLADMLSPAVVGRTGARSLERFLAEEVLAFFNPYKELARSASVTRTADVRGFAFYMDMVSVTGELHPFVIYVIEERGAKVVANVLVDRLVEGRHCFKVPTGWKCPDSS